MRVAARATSWTARLADFVSLTKPRLSSLVLVVVFLSGWLAGGDLITILHAVCATGLVAGGANAINMLFERHLDARMERTRNRPLPGGRLTPLEVGIFGLGIALFGVGWLAVATTPLAAGLAAATLITYVFLYTPLKTRTPLNTLVGAIPGALPGLIGWAAVKGDVGPLPSILFWIVFFWQIPHFLAIAWIYRKDYADGGFCMLPAIDPDGIITGRQATLGAMTLIPVSLIPSIAGMAGGWYATGAVVLGYYFLLRAILFLRNRTTQTARSLLRASLIYLPVLMALLFLDS
ncbi:MAG: heme o synthase [Planctomycetota bacterium]|jgi:protoheme IX farnesyltransferase